MTNYLKSQNNDESQNRDDTRWQKKENKNNMYL